MHAAFAIYLREDLKDKLQELKHHPNESYNSVIERLLTPRGITTSSALRQSKVSRKHWVISGTTSSFSKRGYDRICVLNDPPAGIYRTGLEKREQEIHCGLSFVLRMIGKTTHIDQLKIFQ